MTRWNSEHPAKMRVYRRRWASKNRDKIRAAKRRWWNRHKADRPSSTEAVRRHIAKNRDAYRKKMASYVRKRRTTDPVFALVLNMRGRIRFAVKQQSTSKTRSSSVLLGCTGAELLTHLVSKFTPGMTVAALMDGRIHVDHIRPCASFDLTRASQQRACFHFTNLQPLWAADNRRKGAKTPEVFNAR